MSDALDPTGRIAALEAQLELLRDRLDQLDTPTATHDSHREPRTARGLSRRGPLAAAVAGGASVVAGVVTTAAPAVAAPTAPPQGSPVLIGTNNQAAGYVTIITSDTGRNSSPLGVVNPDSNATSIGIYSLLGASTGMVSGVGYARAAVIGESRDASGVAGFSVNAVGVYAQAVGGSGVYAHAVDGTGVTAISTSGSGLLAVSQSGNAVFGQSDSQCGTYGRSTTGTGAYGISGSGPGVSGISTAQYGVEASGALAPLHLVPATTRGAPTTGAHRAGELFVDKLGLLFFCTKPGTSGTWKKVTLS